MEKGPAGPQAMLVIDKSMYGFGGRDDRETTLNRDWNPGSGSGKQVARSRVEEREEYSPLENILK